MIDGYAAGQLVDALDEGEAQGAEVLTATVLSTDPDGTTWVHVPGGPDRTPLASTTVEPVAGHSIRVRFDGVNAYGEGDYTEPSISAGSAREMMAPIAEAAQQAASGARAAQQQAYNAMQSAESAERAAGEAWGRAGDAADAAAEAKGKAEDAARAADDAQESASAAGTAAAEADRKAVAAGQSAAQAQQQAEAAAAHANSALVQLSAAQDVIGVLDWITEHGTYSPTGDSQVDGSKVYYTRTGSGTQANPYVYSPVAEPTDAGLPGYYELTIDQALSQFVASHLALTDAGLYVLKDSSSWKTLMRSDGWEVQDPTGAAALSIGASGLDFDGSRSWHVGSQDAYILYEPANGSTPARLVIGGTRIQLGSSKTLAQWEASLAKADTALQSSDVTVTQNDTATGYDVEIAGNSFSLVNGQDGESPTVSKSGRVVTITDADGSSVTVSDGTDGSTPNITTSKSGGTTTIYADGAPVGTVSDGANGATPSITATKSGTTTTVKADGAAIATIEDGRDGSTPVITSSKSGGVTTIKADGNAIATVSDGEDGNDASVTVAKSGGTATITATSGDGTQTSVTVNDGAKGDAGAAVIPVTTSYSSAESNWNTWGSAGYQSTWSISESTSGIKVGDTVHMRGWNTTRSCYVWVIAKVTKVNASSLGTTSVGLYQSGEKGPKGDDSSLKYISEFSDGILVHPEGDDTTGWRIRDAIELVKNGITYIKAWLNGSTPTVQIGASSEGNYALIDDDSFDIYHGSTQMAHFGYGEGNAASGTAAAPYYTLGFRKSESAIGNYSHAEGSMTTASGHSSHAEGVATTASGRYSHAEGSQTTASGESSHSEGRSSNATGSGSHAEGSGKAYGINSHAEGFDTTASGDYSHAEGIVTTASGNRSHAEGAATTASGDYSHAQNYQTIAASSSQTALGKYNVSDSSDTYAAIIGNGTSPIARSNALAVRWDGLADVASSKIGAQSHGGNDNTAFPLFIWTTTNPETYAGSYPVSPCFVYYTGNGGLYYCTND